MTPIRAIRQFCPNDCCAGDQTEHRECHLDKCPLHPFGWEKIRSGRQELFFRLLLPNLPLNRHSQIGVESKRAMHQLRDWRVGGRGP